MNCPVTNKIRYATFERARAAAVKQGDGVRWYKCEHCGAYHLTSADWRFPPRKRQKKRT
jgi:hypothetical protein